MNTALRWKRRNVSIFIGVAFCLLFAVLTFQDLKLRMSQTIDTIETVVKDFSKYGSRTFAFEELIRMPGVIPQNDSSLVEFIKDEALFYPKYYKDESILNEFTRQMEKVENKPLDLDAQFGQVNQSAFIDGLLEHKRHGFFVEAGAWDGVYLSNSLFFERHRGWTGLLVEPNKKAFLSLIDGRARTNSTAFHGCLAITPYPKAMAFDAADVFGGVVASDHLPSSDMVGLRQGIKDREMQKAQCFPLYSLLLAMGNPTVDLFSLDVEGAEMGVLLTIPWDKVDIRTILIEVEHSDRKAIRHLLLKKGYKVVKKLKQDYVFQKL